jgi:mannan endo-1,4-beta-mannosidase
MKNQIRLLSVAIIAICFFSCSKTSKVYIELVNPNATQKAKNLYYFIQDIQGKYTLSGQHNFCGKGSEYSDQLEKLTGKKAIIWGSDFSFCVEGEDAMRYQHCGPANLPAFSIEASRKGPDTTQVFNMPEPEFLEITLEEARNQMIGEIKKQYARGHIITLMWHGCYPTEGDCCNGSSIWAMENRPSPEEWDKLVTEGTDLNKAWKENADKVAGYLKQLQDADIPVLWRPYHEMNGVWFWWCNHRGDQGFKRLWIMMYDYFTNHHNLNNLIWVWNTNAPRDIPNDEAWPYEWFYPGNEYVDILAADVYRKDYKQSHHDDLAALAKGKPIALGEVGEIPTDEILKQQSRWSWYMPWGWILFVSNKPDEIISLMNSERVLTLDEIKTDKKGQYSLKTK